MPEVEAAEANRRTFWWALPVLFFAGTAGAAAPRSSQIDEALNQIVSGYHTERLRPGYGLCLFDEQGPIWSHYQGYADEDARTLFSDQTLFRAGAISEIVTAVRVLQLAEAGTVDLSRPVRTYLPEVFDEAPPGSSLARIGDLPIRLILAHLSGSSANYFMGFQDYRPLHNIRRFLRDAPFKSTAGTKYLHAGGLIDLLGLVIEKVEAKPFEAAMQEGIFVPLGMASSSFQYRESPLNASIRYKSGPTDSYLARLSDFRDVQAPSGSLQSSLKDLVSFYGALLSAVPIGPGAVLSSKARVEMFSLQSQSAARLQGIHVGYIWMLSAPDLDYLGEIAWSSGKFLSHRNVVILAHDLGIGVVCATNSWHILERDTIFPLAAAVLEKYAGLALGRQPNRISKAVPRSPSVRRGIGGTYASVYGLYLLESKSGSMILSTNGSYSRLVGCGASSLCPTEAGEVVKIDLASPDTISVTLRTGAVAEAVRQSTSLHLQKWRKHLGTYRIADHSDLTKNQIYAFTLSIRGEALVISGDDGVEYLVKPKSEVQAEITCNEGSSFFGKPLTVTGTREILLDGVLYRNRGGASK